MYDAFNFYIHVKSDCLTNIFFLLGFTTFRFYVLFYLFITNCFYISYIYIYMHVCVYIYVFVLNIVNIQ